MIVFLVVGDDVCVYETRVSDTSRANAEMIRFIYLSAVCFWRKLSLLRVEVQFGFDHTRLKSRVDDERPSSAACFSKRHEDRVRDLSLAFFVGRFVDHLAVDEHRRRTAAIEIHRVDRTEA